MNAEHVGIGFEVGTLNGRGVASRGFSEDEDQERDEAAHYRVMARDLPQVPLRQRRTGAYRRFI